MKQILEGIRVVDCTHAQAGPYASVMLADLGAEVIHVERPGSGDLTRGSKTWFGIPIQLPHGRGSVFFEENNRNKKGMVLDIHQAEGREVLYRLIDKSDVFVTNFRPQALAKMGLDSESLCKRNARLIYGSVSSFGREGPDAEVATIDLGAHARSGIMLASGERSTPPVMMPVGFGDRAAAILLAYGIVAALLARERGGIAQEVDVSLLGSMMTLMGSTVSANLLLGTEYPRFDRTRPKNPLYNIYRCQDEKWIAIAGWMDSQWALFCEAVDAPELNEWQLADADMRAENAESLVSLLDRLFSKKTRDEWVDILNRVRDIPFGPVNSVPELSSDPQVLANDYIVDWDHPVLGPVKFMGFPVKFSKTPCELRQCAPEFGQHTEEILNETCGYSWDEISLLREKAVV